MLRNFEVPNVGVTTVSFHYQHYLREACIYIYIRIFIIYNKSKVYTQYVVAVLHFISHLPSALLRTYIFCLKTKSSNNIPTSIFLVCGDRW